MACQEAWDGRDVERLSTLVGDDLLVEWKRRLDDFEAKGNRGEPFTFFEKKYSIDPNDVAVVVFVRDPKTKHVLQAAAVIGKEVAVPVLDWHRYRR